MRPRACSPLHLVFVFLLCDAEFATEFVKIFNNPIGPIEMRSDHLATSYLRGFPAGSWGTRLFPALGPTITSMGDGESQSVLLKSEKCLFRRSFYFISFMDSMVQDGQKCPPIFWSIVMKRYRYHRCNFTDFTFQQGVLHMKFKYYYIYYSPHSARSCHKSFGLHIGISPEIFNKLL